MASLDKKEKELFVNVKRNDLQEMIKKREEMGRQEEEI